MRAGLSKANPLVPCKGNKACCGEWEPWCLDRHPWAGRQVPLTQFFSFVVIISAYAPSPAKLPEHFRVSLGNKQQDENALMENHSGGRERQPKVRKS